jgi:hypothetical protein
MNILEFFHSLQIPNNPIDIFRGAFLKLLDRNAPEVEKKPRTGTLDKVIIFALAFINVGS